MNINQLTKWPNLFSWFKWSNWHCWNNWTDWPYRPNSLLGSRVSTRNIPSHVWLLNFLFSPFLYWQSPLLFSTLLFSLFLRHPMHGTLSVKQFTARLMNWLINQINNSIKVRLFNIFFCRRSIPQKFGRKKASLVSLSCVMIGTSLKLNSVMNVIEYRSIQYVNDNFEGFYVRAINT